MSQPGYISTLLEKISREGSSVLTFEFSGLQHKIRLYAAAQPTILSAIKTPPSHDEDLAPMVDKLRHRIKRSLGYTSSIPPPLLLGLAALHGYAGPEFQNSSQGLRTLCKIPDVESIDWNELVSVVDDDDENAPPVAAPPILSQPMATSASACPFAADRLSNLEKTVGELAMLFRSMRCPASASQSSDAVPITISSGTISTGPSNHSLPSPHQFPPLWESKSTSPAMAVLGKIYEHLLRYSHTELAAELYGVKNTIDFALLPATQASDGDPENVYTAKHSGKRWKTDHPPPRPCYYCGMLLLACTGERIAQFSVLKMLRRLSETSLVASLLRGTTFLRQERHMIPVASPPLNVNVVGSCIGGFRAQEPKRC